MTLETAEISPLPCVLLSHQTSVYASFAPLPFINGSTSNPKDVFFSSDLKLFKGPIDDFIYAMQHSLNIKTDVILSFQDMELDLHSDSYMTNSISLDDIHQVYVDMRLVQNYLGKIPPLKVKIIEMASNFRQQLMLLKESNKEALKIKKANPYLNKGDCENPISIDDDLNMPGINQAQGDVIVIDDEDDVEIDARKKVTRPFVRRKRKLQKNKRQKGLKHLKDLRGSSSILRFILFK